jgi:hypothetical protein
MPSKILLRYSRNIAKQENKVSSSLKKFITKQQNKKQTYIRHETVF